MARGKRNKKRSSGNRTTATAPPPPRQAPLAPVDREGRMPEAEGRRFYALLDFIATIVRPRVQQEHPSFQWDPSGVAANSMESRTVMVDYMLHNIEDISQEIDSGRHDGLFKRMVGRRLGEGDKRAIRSWKWHVSDDFFVVDHIPKKGSVLVQVGRLPQASDAPGPIYREEDVHEPRVFLIRGLASPFGEMCESPKEEFIQKHPYIEYDLPLALLYTTVIPYNGGLTFMTNLMSYSQNHYSSPAAFADAARVAVEAYHAAFSDDPDRPKLYTNLTEDNVAICRLASIPENAFRRNIARQNILHGGGERQANSPTQTSIAAALMIWYPIINTEDPEFSEQLLEAAQGTRPLLEVREGFKRQLMQETTIEDEEPCPFHRRMGKGTPFKDCCKEAHLKRGREVYFYNPLGPEEADYVERIHESSAGTSPMDCARLSIIDTCSVNVTFDRSYVAVIQERLNACPFFHATGPYKWNYIGRVPMVMKKVGMLVFGDIDLDSSGFLKFEGMTSERLEKLIHEIHVICEGIPVNDAKVLSMPFNKRKPDKEALARNVALVNESFGKEASFSMDKKMFRGKHCEYCGSREEEELRRCLCKQVYYCSKEHQKLHWKMHKRACSAAKK